MRAHGKPSPGKSLEDIYRKFVQFEEQAAAIYFNMASRFYPAHPELGGLWLDMGMQEKQHAGLVQFCLVEGLFAANLPSNAEIRKLEEAFSKLARRAAAPALTIAEAFQIAVEMETSEVNAIYSHLTTPLHNSMYMLRRKITVSMPDHVRRLVDEARKYGVPESMLSGLCVA